jgi:hypothetical protein
MLVDLATDELERVLERISGRLTHAEPQARVRSYVSGLVDLAAGQPQPRPTYSRLSELIPPPARGCRGRSAAARGGS